MPLGQLGLAALRRRVAQAAERLRADTWDDHGFVFTNGQGGPLAVITLLRAQSGALDAAGGQRLPLHATRHTAAMVAFGANPRVASERLGHAMVAMTMDLYSHISDALRVDAANAIDKIVRTA